MSGIDALIALRREVEAERDEIERKYALLLDVTKDAWEEIRRLEAEREELGRLVTSLRSERDAHQAARDRAELALCEIGNPGCEVGKGCGDCFPCIARAALAGGGA